MRTLLALALLAPALALAQVPVHGETPAPDPDLQQPAEEKPREDAPAPPPEAAPSAPADAPSSAQLDAPLAPEPAELKPVAHPEQQRLVSGAPLDNPNVAVHVVQKKRFADAGRHELVLYPGVAQANGKFTQHYGSGLGYVYHLQENFALQVTGQYNWYARESDFNQEIIAKVRERAQTASSLLLQWGTTAGVEVAPLYGKFAFYDDSLAQFSVVISGGAGVGSTRHLLRPAAPSELDGRTVMAPERYGDTGLKFLGHVGGGFRVQFGERFALRLEVRDLVYTARVDRVNGCSAEDFGALRRAHESGTPFADVPVSGGCNKGAFDGTDPSTGQNRRDDLLLGEALVAEPSSDALNNVSFYSGFSLVF